MFKLNRKEKGSFEDILVMMVFIFFAAIIILLMIYISQAIETKSKLNTIAREYMLRMETEGYLTHDTSGVKGSSNQKQNLIDALNTAGFKKNAAGTQPVDASCLTGTTETAQGYGNKIILKINVYGPTVFKLTPKIEEDGQANIFGSKFVGGYDLLTIELISTSKK